MRSLLGTFDYFVVHSSQDGFGSFVKTENLTIILVPSVLNIHLVVDQIVDVCAEGGPRR